jgi:hypothetical protein
VGGSVQDHCRAPIYTSYGGSTTFSAFFMIKGGMEAIGKSNIVPAFFPFFFFSTNLYMLIFLA